MPVIHNFNIFQAWRVKCDFKTHYGIFYATYIQGLYRFIPHVMVCYKSKIEIQMLGTILYCSSSDKNWNNQNNLWFYPRIVLIFGLFLNDDKINNVHRVKRWNMLAKIYLRLYLCIPVCCVCLLYNLDRCLHFKGHNKRKSKMRDTTGNQLSIIWFVLRCATCLIVMFGITGKLRFWIKYILTSFDYYAKIGWQVIEVFHEQKTPGQNRKIVEKILKIISIELLLFEKCHLVT